MNQNKQRKIIIWDDIIMITLALVSAYLLVLEITTDLTAIQRMWFYRIDIIIALVFLCEFIIRFFLAKLKWEFFKENWWYLLASIPISTPVTQASRLFRLLGLVRLVRLTRVPMGVHKILNYMEQFEKQTHIAYVFVVWLVMVFSGSLVFFAFEHTVNPNVESFFDGFWYSIVTITTVGYGDIYPLTVGGRIVGILLMICGIGMTGVFIALISSFFVNKSIQKKHEGV